MTYYHPLQSYHNHPASSICLFHFLLLFRLLSATFPHRRRPRINNSLFCDIPHVVNNIILRIFLTRVLHYYYHVIVVVHETAPPPSKYYPQTHSTPTSAECTHSFISDIYQQKAHQSAVRDQIPVTNCLTGWRLVPFIRP